MKEKELSLFEACGIMMQVGVKYPFISSKREDSLLNEKLSGFVKVKIKAIIKVLDEALNPALQALFDEMNKIEDAAEGNSKMSELLFTEKIKISYVALPVEVMKEILALETEADYGILFDFISEVELEKI